MKIEVTRVVDIHGDGQVHACWPHHQQTLCGRSKVNWPYPPGWNDPLTCRLCRAVLLDEGVEALQDYIGWPDEDESEVAA